MTLNNAIQFAQAQAEAEKQKEAEVQRIAAIANAMPLTEEQIEAIAERVAEKLRPAPAINNVKVPRRKDIDDVVVS